MTASGLVLTASLLIGAQAKIGDFRALLARDCSVIYYAPLAYSVNPQRSSVLPDKKADQIILNLAMDPKRSEPSVSENTQLLKWAMRQSECMAKYPAITAYPEELQSADFYVPAGDLQITAGPAFTSTKGRQNLRIAINIAAISTADAVRSLREIVSGKVLRSYKAVQRASVRLTAKVTAAASFLHEHFTERTCTVEERCDGLSFFRSCSNSENCAYTPKETHYIENFSHTSGITIETNRGANVSEAQLADMRNQVLSRFTVSVFRRNMAAHVGTFFQVRYALPTESMEQVYEDELVLETVDEEQSTLPLTTNGTAEFAKPQIERLYAQMKGKK